MTKIDNLWKVGFSLETLPAVQLLNGLADIVETYWNNTQEAVIFVVQMKDTTGTLFENGTLVGERVNHYRSPTQGFFVDLVGLNEGDQIQG